MTDHKQTASSKECDHERSAWFLWADLVSKHFALFPPWKRTDRLWSDRSRKLKVKTAPLLFFHTCSHMFHILTKTAWPLFSIVLKSKNSPACTACQFFPNALLKLILCNDWHLFYCVLLNLALPPPVFSAICQKGVISCAQMISDSRDPLLVLTL